MKVVKVYSSTGVPISEYPDAYAHATANFIYVFDSGIHEGNRRKDPQGNWLACISGPAIIIEENQDNDHRFNRSDVSRGN